MRKFFAGGRINITSLERYNENWEEYQRSGRGVVSGSEAAPVKNQELADTNLLFEQDAGQLDDDRFIRCALEFA